MWVSVSGAIQEVKNIAEGLIEVDPKNADAYRNNSKIYEEKLEKLKIRIHEQLKDIRNRDIVTFHEAFPYFAKELDLNIIVVVEREPGSEPSAGELADIIKDIKEKNVEVIFTEPQYSSKAAQSIASQTGAKIFSLEIGRASCRERV